MSNDLLKRTIAITVGALLLGAGAASAQSSSSSQASTQSLGDAARAARKNRPQSDGTVRHYDNDNLPTTETLSVVGPEPSAQPNAAQQSASAAADSRAADEKQQQAKDIKDKLDAQKTKIDQLAHELDLDQREYRLRAAAFYSDAGNRLRDAAQWDKEDSQYKTDIDSKQKALNEAKAQLTDMQEEARKAGVKEKENDGSDKNKDSDKGNTDNK